MARLGSVSARPSTSISVRLGGPADVDAATSIYVRSNLVRRKGRPIAADRVEEVTASLRNPACWFLVASDGPNCIAMASAMPAREDAGAGPLIPGACYLDLIYVLPERWGEGIGGKVLDAVLDEARRRGYSRVQLWTHDDNELARRLYRSRGFSRTRVTRVDSAGAPVSEWAVGLSK